MLSCPASVLGHLVRVAVVTSEINLRVREGFLHRSEGAGRAATNVAAQARPIADVVPRITRFDRVVAADAINRVRVVVSLQRPEAPERCDPERPRARSVRPGDGPTDIAARPCVPEEVRSSGPEIRGQEDDLSGTALRSVAMQLHDNSNPMSILL